MRTARTVRKLPIGRPAAEPLVTRRRVNPEPPTQLAPIRPFYARKTHKLTTLVHDRHLVPRHGSPPWQSNPCHDDVSVMSPNTCRGCLRAVHLSRPSRLGTQCPSKRDARVKPAHDGVCG